ncbi:NAD-binding domain 4 protein [Mycena vulgaris]|nr:NAD-binding domain 4 protein [Mycena vulgaris]
MLSPGPSALPPLESTFFRGQAVFLTGATGGLGGCLLYKLALTLETGAIYVLVRGSWRRTMPLQIERILATGRVRFVVGDMTKEELGIEKGMLAEMARRVTVVIHSAGNISLTDPLRESVQNNCLPVLQLAQLASSFKHLIRFVHISTAYVNCFLPDGSVEERIYDAGDGEAQLREILQTGSLPVSQELSKFSWPWPYAFAKHLTERLLLARYPHLPTLIVRPTLIGPALAQPQAFYGPSGTNPVSTYMRAYFAAPDSGVVRGPSAGANVVDELPVDLVANLILLHAVHGTRGIAHAGSQLCGTRTLARLHADMRATGMPTNFSYVADPPVREGVYARFWMVAGKDWRFSVAASEKFKGQGGLLSVDVGEGAFERFMQERARRIAEEVKGRNKALPRL